MKFRKITLKGLLKKLNGGQLTLLGFFLIAVVGMLLLMLPISNVYGVWTNPVDALFTSISAVCVTGLIIFPTGTYWTIFGQTVIIFLIQIGGLGFMTFMTMFYIAVGRRITIHDRLLIQSAINSDHITGIVKFIKHILFYAISIELIGAFCLALAFVPQYGFIRGLYFSVWHSISMYCNAGFDLMASVGQSSFTAYVSNLWVSNVIVLLIIVGGLGFAVYVDILDFHKRRKFSLHSKAVFIMTGFLLLIGTLLFFCFEYNNPDTIGNLSFIGKLNASLFQATTPRTAGANTIDQSLMTDPSLMLTNVLMFIGASPGSTGGGIKTTTVFIILLTVWTVLMGRKHVNVMRREITRDYIRRALAVFTIGILVILVTFFILMVAEPLIDVRYLLFELLSAYNTVGLSTGITPELSVISKLVLIFCMFVGRVGILTIAYVLTNTERRMMENKGHFKLPPGNILIG